MDIQSEQFMTPNEVNERKARAATETQLIRLQEENTALLALVKEVVEDEPIYTLDLHSWVPQICFFCQVEQEKLKEYTLPEGWYLPIKHEPDCWITRARAILSLEKE